MQRVMKGCEVVIFIAYNGSGFAFGRELELQMFIKPQKMIEEIKVEDNNVCPHARRPVLVAVLITEHAHARAKERLVWKSKVLDKMAEKAFTEGIRHKDTKGSLMRYLTKLWFNYKHCNNVRIYGENIFFFLQQQINYRLSIAQCFTEARQVLQLTVCGYKK